MNTNIQNIAILTSGGDSPGMNACIRAVTRAAIYENLSVYGVLDGFNGLIDDEFIPLNYSSVSNIINRGGTILSTERSKRFFETEYRKIAFENLQKKNINALVVIGGDGSYKGMYALAKEYGIKVIGIPGSIDNDIAGSEYSIGFDTALNTIVESIDKIRDTASSHHRIFLVEVMGNTSGVLAINAAIATGAEDVFLPERQEDLLIFEKKIELALAAKKSSVIVVSEGDQIGGASELYHYLAKKGMEDKVRVSVLGHIQRGGAPTYRDRILATKFGVKAVELLLSGQSNLVVGLKNSNVYAYEMQADTTKSKPKDMELAKLIRKLSVY